MNKPNRHTSRGRKLTPEEAAKFKEVRRQVEQDKPAIAARVKARLNEISDLSRIFVELKHCREQQNLSLADIQQRTGIDRSALSKLENGQRENFTLDTVLRYAEAVGQRVVLELAKS
jgi:predicted XRE-type DNA-binding protein